MHPIEGAVKPDKSSGRKPKVCGGTYHERLASEDVLCTENINSVILVEYILHFLLVKFREITFNGCRLNIRQVKHTKVYVNMYVCLGIHAYYVIITSSVLNDAKIYKFFNTSKL